MSLQLINILYFNWKTHHSNSDANTDIFIVFLMPLVSLKSPSVISWLACLPLDPRFAGSNPAEGDGFLKVIKIRCTTSFRRKVKTSAPCHNILRHVKKPYRYENKILRRQNSPTFLDKIFLLFYQIILVVIARELWWMNHE
jgi:hypothetical protein